LRDCSIGLNGGIHDLDAAGEPLKRVDGVRLGRAAYRDPYLFADADRRIFGDAEATVPTRRQVLQRYLAYMHEQHRRGVPLAVMARHLPGLWHGQPGSRRLRRSIGETLQRPGADLHALQAAADCLGPAGPSPA